MSAQTATGFLAVLFFLQLQLLPFSGAVVPPQLVPFSNIVLPPLTDSPYEAFNIARQAFTFFVPVVNNWRFLSLSTNLGEIPFDEFRHGEDFRPPNENVIYSTSWLDVRQEPRVITVPPDIQERYYSVQIIDGYTHNVGIVSERTFPTPTQSGNFVVAGPGQCDPPSSCTCNGINEEDIFYAESVFVLVLIRIQAFGQLDIALGLIADAQQGFGITKLSTFCGVTSPAALPLPPFFFVPVRATLSTDYFGFVNLILPLMFRGPHLTERGLFQNFAKIGIIPGAQDYPPAGLSFRVVQAIRLGIVAAFTQVNIDINRPSTGTFRGGWWLVVQPPQFGNRTVMQGRYLTRAAAARGGIYGLDPQEALYPFTRNTLYGNPLDGSENTPYYMMFNPSTLPPVLGDDPLDPRRGFWSITMHTRFNFTVSFVPNPINRFSIGSRELLTFCRNPDGSFPIIMQAEPPTEPAFFRNWLPAPDGLFILLARLYAARPEAIADPYLPPPVRLGYPPEVPTECPSLPQAA